MIIGLVGLLYWFLDFINIVFIIRRPEYLLWYSSVGLLLTSLALYKRNVKLISIMFCALFFIEGIWALDYVSKIFLRVSPFGLTNYLFEPGFVLRDRIMTSYHVYIPIMLLRGVSSIKKIYHLGWVGALVYVIVLAVLTIMLTKQSEAINCISNGGFCKNSFSFLFSIVYPYNVFLGIFFLTVLIYIPTNYLLIKFAERFHWEVV